MFNAKNLTNKKVKNRKPPKALIPVKHYYQLVKCLPVIWNTADTS